MIWFTADTHFGHRGIMDYVPRHFSSIEKHDQTLIDNWNQCVGSNDEVVFAGDFSFWPKKITREIFHSLRGKIKRLVCGNHDHKDVRNLPWDSVDMIREFVIEDKLVVVCHYPMVQWNKSHYGSIHLHGHVHGTMFTYGRTRMDVGVDAHDYKPISWEQIKARSYTVNGFNPKIHRGSKVYEEPPEK